MRGFLFSLVKSPNSFIITLFFVFLFKILGFVSLSLWEFDFVLVCFGVLYYRGYKSSWFSWVWFKDEDYYGIVFMVDSSFGHDELGTSNPTRMNETVTCICIYIIFKISFNCLLVRSGDFNLLFVRLHHWCRCRMPFWINTFIFQKIFCVTKLLNLMIKILP